MASLISKLAKCLTDKEYRFLINSNLNGCPGMKDEEFLRRKFRLLMGSELDLDNPKTFNEKLQWLKLHDRKPEYTKLVDKYLVRDYIREKLGEEYLIPLIGVWDSPEEIDFDALPDKFVLKCNHNSGLGMYICKDKSQMDTEKVRRELRRGLAQDYYLTGREWPYKDVPRKIICEKFMINEGEKDLKDYKIQCLNGKIDHIFVCVGRSEPGNLRYYFFDRDWNHLPYSVQDSDDEVYLGSLKPKNLEKMIEIAEILCVNHPEIRVDLYEINGKVYFGELTFFTSSGFDDTITPEADAEIGSRFVLPRNCV